MSHRSVVNWKHWLAHDLGALVLEAERELLDRLVSGLYGKHAVLIGVPGQSQLLHNLSFPCHALVTPFSSTNRSEVRVIESNFHELPLLSSSVDLVILPHTLELIDNPRQLLAEACRIVKPEGHLLLCGFNPFSLWGLGKIFRPHSSRLPIYHPLKLNTLRKWLLLADFELSQHQTALYLPPWGSRDLLKRLHFMETLGQRCHLPCGAVYALMAKAKFLPLTPLRLRWKHSLARIPLPTTIPGSSARNSQ